MHLLFDSPPQKKERGESLKIQLWFLFSFSPPLVLRTAGWPDGFQTTCKVDHLSHTFQQLSNTSETGKNTFEISKVSQESPSSPAGCENKGTKQCVGAAIVNSPQFERHSPVWGPQRLHEVFWAIFARLKALSGAAALLCPRCSHGQACETAWQLVLLRP